MNTIIQGKLEDISKDFVPPEYQVDRNNPYMLRDMQSDSSHFRGLDAGEIEILVKNNNTAESWDKVLVSDNFDPNLVRNCDFWGLVRIGDLTPEYLEFHKLRIPVGLRDCTIISCDIGDKVAMRNVHYLSHYIIGHHCILVNIDEMLTVDNAKFGNGIVKDGEDEDVRIWIEVANENGGRAILPFAGMLPADAWIWSRFRDDSELMQSFKKMTDDLGDRRRGYYGQVGDRTVIKDCRVIKNARIGSDAYIKGANKLKNLTIQSSESEETQIGEGVELVNGIVGFKNRIFYGVKAVRFVTGRNVQLKYGARLINSMLGPNSTISCCEVLNNLIFPFHEQHHNNSFLIAATVMGQSNIAAGVTLGSNHNSRAADGEVIARRGFWPGLTANFKHNSMFASFTLVAKGTYYKEMNITLPFCLVSPGPDESVIRLFPGFWFKYNMYALARNAWKFGKRDKREVKEQHIETDYLAPDTIEEIFSAIDLLQQAIRKTTGQKPDLQKIDQALPLDKTIRLELDGIINGGKALVLKPVQGIWLYRTMVFYYGARALFNWLWEGISSGHQADSLLARARNSYRRPDTQWFNCGGQIISGSALSGIRNDIKTAKLNTWADLHRRYDHLWKKYPEEKRNHAIFSLFRLLGIDFDDLTEKLLVELLIRFRQTCSQLLAWAFESREKDYTNKFRTMTYENPAEMEAVLGTIADNSFLNDYKQEMDQQIQNCNELINILRQEK